MFIIMDLVPAFQAQSSNPIDTIALVIAILALIFSVLTYVVRIYSISLHIGPTIQLVNIGPGSKPKIHVICAMVNSGTGTGIVRRLRVTTTGPNGSRQFRWRVFWNYVPGTLERKDSRNIHPIAIAPSESQLEFIEFQGATVADTSYWTEGKYSAQIRADLNPLFFNKWKRRAKRDFEFELTAKQAHRLTLELRGPDGEFDIVDVPVTVAE